MAGKIIANLIVLGSGVLLRAFSQAYRQAIVNASRTGVAQETVQNLAKSSKSMTEQEARMILGVSEKTTVEDMLQVRVVRHSLLESLKSYRNKANFRVKLMRQKYENLFERNAKSGSFYLQSKVQRAKECLEASQEMKGSGNT